MSICEKIKILLESPDYMVKDGKDITSKQSDAHSFLFGKNKKFYYDEVSSRDHGSFWRTIDDDQRKANYNLSGRVWTKRKVISFWRDNKIKPYLKQVVDGLKKHGIDLNDDWVVELSGRTRFSPSKFVSFEEYSGLKMDRNKDKEKEHELHLLSPIEKEKLRKQGKLGTKPVHNKKLPKGMTLAQYHHLTKQESVDEV